jgi:hypothetical protein
MIRVTTARKIILSMPEAEESQHHGHPDFRVNNKIFATLWPGEQRVVLKIGWDGSNPVLRSSPEALSKNPWSKQGWTNVHLRYIAAAIFHQLVEEAWYSVAPKRLASNYGSGEPGQANREW